MNRVVSDHMVIENRTPAARSHKACLEANCGAAGIVGCSVYKRYDSDEETEMK